MRNCMILRFIAARLLYIYISLIPWLFDTRVLDALITHRAFHPHVLCVYIHIHFSTVVQLIHIHYTPHLVAKTSIIKHASIIPLVISTHLAIRNYNVIHSNAILGDSCKSIKLNGLDCVITWCKVCSNEVLKDEGAGSFKPHTYFSLWIRRHYECFLCVCTCSHVDTFFRVNRLPI